MNPPRRDHLDGRIVVWIAHLSQAKEALPVLDSFLDARDRERAARFRFPDDRARFIIGRALIRQGLGRYLGQPPEGIDLAYTDLGRPYFPHDEKIAFSLSHTQELVAFALTSGARVGIDLEAIQPNLDLPELAERIFFPVDLAKFQALPFVEKLPAFYRAWTRKEAYLKARGEGIAEALQQISVSFGTEASVPIADTRCQPPESWRLITPPLPAGYAGALACDETRRLEGAFVRIAQGSLAFSSAF